MAEEIPFITIYIMGETHKVPADLTIMRALEYAGYHLVRETGCREGFCGSCKTIYRLPGDYKIHTALACSTMVKDQMHLTPIPNVPTSLHDYEINELKPETSTFQKICPELFDCIKCNSCSKACPLDLKVMGYVQAVIRGDIALCTKLSFDCVACGLCALRCPVDIVPHEVGLLARRLFGKYLNPKGNNLKNRLDEIKKNKYQNELKKLKHMGREELLDQYFKRDIEPK